MLSLANRDASLPVAYRLYLPEGWSKDQGFRAKLRYQRRSPFKASRRSPLSRSRRRAAGLHLAKLR
jgi:SRSO17 transposase